MGVGAGAHRATIGFKQETVESIAVMDPHHRLQLANRIHLGLMRELGQGLDLKQMLGSTLYARDVLLVCQAYPDTELPQLAEQFREATAEWLARRTGWPRDSSGFGASKPAVSTYSGFDDLGAEMAEPRQPARRWLTPSSWFSR